MSLLKDTKRQLTRNELVALNFIILGISLIISYRGLQIFCVLNTYSRSSYWEMIKSRSNFFSSTIFDKLT